MVHDIAPAVVSVHEQLGPLLMLRGSVAPLFKAIEAATAPQVTVDFSLVEFMSRSFASEYLASKASSPKRIQERGMSLDVIRMFAVVATIRRPQPSRQPTPRRVRPATV